MSEAEDLSLRRFYDSLWEDAESAWARGAIVVDENLKQKERDRRRGLSLIFRLKGAPVEQMEAWVQELKSVDKGQYFYTAPEFHVTVLSMLTATVDYGCTPEQIAAYARTVGEALTSAEAVTIRFEGLTATAEAVMIQGFSEHDGLNRLRAQILKTMEARQIPVRQRYLPRAAHVTVMRFCQSSEDLPALAEKLRSNRRRAFGTCVVGKIELVENDWYMSANKLRVIESYRLGT
jgi:2'-5' RNA ligase